MCCNDYNYEVIFGNIMEQPLSMILESDLYQEYKRGHETGQLKHLKLCKDCNYTTCGEENEEITISN